MPTWLVNLVGGYLVAGFVLAAFLTVAYFNLAGEIRRMSVEVRLQAAYLSTLTAELVKQGVVEAGTAAQMQVLLRQGDDNQPEEE